jgi:ABC-type antimicrobial peptide transport system permease subunit
MSRGGGFSLVAMVLALVGLYGVLSLSVGSRTKEFAVRAAVGAEWRGIVGMVMDAGLAGGAALAAWLVRFVASYMYKASVYDPIAWALAFGLLLEAATLGVLIPALRASRTNPIDALRVE